MTLKDKYIALVKDYGFNGRRFRTFDYCSDYGFSLDDSTIDKIEINDDEVLFYYNENTNDWATFENFTLSGLWKFYKDLTSMLWTDEGLSRTQRDTIKVLLTGKFKGFFDKESDLNNYIDALTIKVCNDILETADWTDYDSDEVNVNDIEIAVERILLNGVGLER